VTPLTRRVILATASTVVVIPLAVMTSWGAMFFSHDHSLTETVDASLTLSVFAVPIALLFTPLFGLIAVDHIRRVRPVGLPQGMLIGALVGSVPFLIITYAMLRNEGLSWSTLWAALMLPSVGAVCGIAAAMSFWYIVIRPDPALRAPRH